MDNHGHAVSQPIGSLQYLIDWKLPNNNHYESKLFHHGKGRREFKNSRHADGQPKVLVCHDMAGGYLDDRFLQGCPKKDSQYSFYHWHLIDTFVYFSHHFITIPPTGWIIAAHKHGVNILGTIITEWEDGAEICKLMLDSEEKAFELTTKLADIASFFGFDGWLINIENKVEPHQLPLLKVFVQQLTQKCHNQLHQGTVLWYDSVINTGELKWQDELNSSNEMFFEVCDGIFLNYCITSDKLSGSRRKALSCDRVCDVYVGIDVFGRGTPGGGGFNCREVVEMIAREGLSYAIFAPGWVLEHLGPENFLENNVTFWGLLADLLTTRPIPLPFFSSFCQGHGHKYYLHGEVKSHDPWFNLGLQAVQPSFDQSQFLSYTIKRKVVPIDQLSEAGRAGDEDSSEGIDLQEDKADMEASITGVDGNTTKLQGVEMDVTGGLTNVAEIDVTAVGVTGGFANGCEIEEALSNSHPGSLDSQADTCLEGNKMKRCSEAGTSAEGNKKVRGDAESDIQKDPENKEPEAASSDKTKEEIKIAVIVEEKQTTKPRISVDLDAAYNGGGSLHLQAHSVANDPVIFKLFNIAMGGRLGQLSVTWKPQVGGSFDFGLLLSDSSKEASLENALIMFETSVSTSTKGLLQKRLPKSSLCCHSEPGEFCNEYSWTTSTFKINPEVPRKDQKDTPMTLSAMLIPLKQPEGDGTVCTVDAGSDMSVWLGYIEAQGVTDLNKEERQPLICNLRLLEVKMGPTLSTRELEQIRTHSSFYEESQLQSERLLDDHRNGSEMKENEISQSVLEVEAKIPVLKSAVQKGYLLNPSQVKKLDLTSLNSAPLDHCSRLFLLKWETSNLSLVDHFVIFEVDETGITTFLGHSTSECFVYKVQKEVKNVSYYIQPVFSL